MFKNKSFIGIEPIYKKSKKDIIRRIIEKYDFRMLKREIESYGYRYSFKNFILSSFLYLGITLAVSLYMRLRIEYIIILGITILLVVPFIIRSQFHQMYEIKRFEMVTDYLENVIPIFKRTPIITNTWKEILDLLEGEMKEIVEKALNKIMTNTDDPEVIKNAFYIIESEFPNSRIHSVHQMMYTIETQNTKNYTMSIDNVWLDVQSWITRISIYQKNLKERKNKLILLTLLTMGSNCLFVSMYSSNDVFMHFTDHIIYQISSTFFMITLILTTCLFQMKLTGNWLLDDQNVKMAKNALKSFQYIQNKKTEIRIQDKVLSAIFIVLSVFIYVNTANVLLSIICILISYMIYTTMDRLYKKNLNHVKKYLSIEFPSWLRDISLNLQNLTVTNAIEASRNTSSTILNYYIDKLLAEIFFDPVSIKPYNNFLEEFHIDGIKSSMKTLYSLQTLNRDEMNKQTNYLIVRNQELLAKAENLKNDDSISGLKLLGFVPIVIFIVQMLISMGLLFSVMIDLLNISVNL